MLNATTDRTDAVYPHLAVADKLDCPVQPTYLATEFAGKEALVTIPDTRDERTVTKIPERPSLRQDPEPLDGRTHSVGVAYLVASKQGVITGNDNTPGVPTAASRLSRDVGVDERVSQSGVVVATFGGVGDPVLELVLECPLTK